MHVHYGHFILSPLMEGQADTIGIAMRRVLLGEIEGTCIARVKSEKVPPEYSIDFYGAKDVLIML